MCSSVMSSKLTGDSVEIMVRSLVPLKDTGLILVSSVQFPHLEMAAFINRSLVDTTGLSLENKWQMN